MRSLCILGLLLLSVLSHTVATPCGSPANTDRTPIIVTDEPPVIQSPEEIPAGPRTEITSDVSKNSSEVNTSSNTKTIQKVKTKELKNGNTVTVIVDKTKTKNKTKELSDTYVQTNHTIVEDGLVDQISLTKEKQQQVKEVSVAKNVTRQRIVTDDEGNIVSDTVKSKALEKDRKTEKIKVSETLIHTVKNVTESPVTREATTELPPLPCGCTSTTTTETPQLPGGCRKPLSAID